MTRIVSIGECMVEMAPSGTGPDDYRMGFAGDTMNTAWYLRRLLGTPFEVDYLTAVGTDATSDRMLSFMRDAGIGTDHISRRPDRTVGLYMVQLQDGERSFSYWRGQSAARTLAEDAGTLRQALTGARVAYFSGITIAVLPPDDRTRFLGVLAEHRADGGQIVFDPNLRPRLWNSPRDMTEAIMAAAEVSSLILPSFDDEATFFGDGAPADTVQRYEARGAEEIVVKNGAGQILASSNGSTSTHTPDVIGDVVDTTAAGDSFNAGYLAARLHGQDVSDALRQGATLAAKVVQARGALVTDIG